MSPSSINGRGGGNFGRGGAQGQRVQYGDPGAGLSSWQGYGNVNGGRNFNAVGYNYCNGRGRDGFAGRGGFNGGGRGFPAGDGNGGGDFKVIFHPGSGDEFYDNLGHRNRRRNKFRGNHVAGHNNGRGGGRGRAHENPRYAEVNKNKEKQSDGGQPLVVSDAAVSAAVSKAISAVVVQQVVSGSSEAAATPTPLKLHGAVMCGFDN